MKPFLGINITEDKKNTYREGSELPAAQPSEFVAAERDRAIAAMKSAERKSKLPLPLRIVENVCGFTSAFILVAIFKAMSRAVIGPAQVYINVPYMVWICGISLVIWAPLFLLAMIRRTSFVRSSERTYAVAKMASASDSALAELGVPAIAAVVDIIEVKYKLKKGKPRIKDGIFADPPYKNNEYRLYTDDDKLCIADIFGRYDFPLDSLLRIRTVNKTVHIKSWNKMTPMNSGVYKKYSIETEKYFNYLKISRYHILELEYMGEIWGIYFPNYELPAFECITGLKAE